MKTRKSLSVIFLLVLAMQPVASLAQVKTYLLIGRSDMFYHNKNNDDMPTLSRWYYGIEVEKYINYNYALTTGLLYQEGGYDNNLSRWVNKFIQVPLGIKMAPLGDKLGLVGGINLNYLLRSELTEICDQQNHKHKNDVTSALDKVQPDIAWGLLFRLKRVTAQFKFSHALSNRFSTKVKTITDDNGCYYGSYYVYVIGEKQKKLNVTTTYFTLSYRLF